MKNRLFLPLLCLFLGSSSAVAAPANNNFANAHVLTGDFDVHSGTTVDATLEAGEPEATTNATVWYKWTPTRAGRARISVLPPNSGYRYWSLTVWVGTSLGNLKLIAYDHDSGGGGEIENLPVSEGRQYFICVGHESSYTQYRSTFDVSVVLPTDSDLSSRNVTASAENNGIFANAMPLSGASNTVISYAWNFPSREPGEPVRNPEFSSWYRYDATADGRVSLSVAGTELSHYYSYYSSRTIIAYNVDTYAEMLNASPVRTSSSSEGLPGTLSFDVIAGQTYHIAFGQGRYINGSLFGPGYSRNTAWRVMTMSYSPSPPTVTTDPVSSVTANSATAGGEVTGVSGTPVTERGVVISTSSTPNTSSGTKVIFGSGPGVFSGNILNLYPSTKYYVRSYAFNSAGTGYGTVVNFTTESSPGVPPNATSQAVTNALKTALTNKYNKLKKKLKKTKDSSKKKKLKKQLKAFKKKISAL